MIATDNFQISVHGHDLDMADDCLGQFIDDTHLLGDVGNLRQHMDEHGYIYLPGYLDRPQVLEMNAGTVLICRRMGRGRSAG